MTDVQVPVAIDVTVIPDGFTDTGNLRVSLRLAPRIPLPGEQGIALESWPATVGQLAVTLYGKQVTFPDNRPPTLSREQQVGSATPMGWPEEISNAAAEHWKQVFAPMGFARFRADLEAEAAQPGAGLVEDAAPELRYYPEAEMGRVLDAITAQVMTAQLVRRQFSSLVANGTLPPAQHPKLEQGELPWELWDALAGAGEDRTAPDRREQNLVAGDTSARAQVSHVQQSLAQIADEMEALPEEQSLTESAAGLAQHVASFRAALRMDIGTDADTLREQSLREPRGSNDAPAAAEYPASMRKLSEMLAHPSLAKYFGLILDVQLTPAQAAALLSPRELAPPSSAARHYGVLAARLTTKDGKRFPGDDAALHWSATVFAEGVGPGDGYFGPCGRDEMKSRCYSTKHEFLDGVVNLGALENGRPRFSLHAEDIVQSMQAATSAATALTNGRAEGMPEFEQSLRPAERHGGALMLLDRLQTLRNDQELRPPRERLDGPPGDAHISFALDLLQGYRPDVALLRSADTPESAIDSSRWRSLVGRDLRFPNPLHVHPGLSAALGSVREREDGFVGTPPGTEPPVANDEKPRVIVDDRIFSWRGEGLGVPSLQQDEQVDTTDEGRREMRVSTHAALAIDMVYDLPSGAADWRRKPPPLREGRLYKVGLRACWINGCGLTAEQGVKRYFESPDDATLGSDTRTAFRFVRQAEIQAPDVLLPWDDRLVKVKNPATEAPGESILTLVVRSEGMPTTRARRMLMPGRVSFDAAEQSGILDEFKGVPKPRGAFEGALRFQAGRVGGGYPVARDGTWVFPDHPARRQGEPGSPEKEPNRGSVLVLDRRAQGPGRTYHADLLARDLCARFVREDEFASRFGSLPGTVAFWRGDESHLAQPLVLELRPAERSDSRVGWFEQPQAVSVRQLHGGALPLRAIVARLAKGEEVELELFAAPPAAEVATRHGAVLATQRKLIRWANAMAATPAARMGDRSLLGADHPESKLRALADLTDRGLALLQQFLCEGPLPQLTSVQRVRLVHAVPRPLASPAVATVGGAPQLAAVVLSVNPEPQVAKEKTSQRADAEGPELTWSDYVVGHRGRPIGEWESAVNGSTAFFVGALMLHRPSTGKVRGEATWYEFDSGGLEKDAHGLWRFEPRAVPRTQLFSIDQVPMSERLRDQPFSLTTGEPGFDEGVRAFAHSFPDAKARRLQVSFVATSRFTDYFEPESGPERAQADGDGVGRFETRSEHPVEVWVAATARPQPVQVDRVIPVFRWEREDPVFRGPLTWRRKTTLRIYLAGDWYSSGEGEQLGIVFADIPATSLCDFEDGVEGFGQFVTRWGTDPIHDAYDLQHIVPQALIENGDVVTGQRLAYVAPAKLHEVLTPCAAGIQLPAGTRISIAGENFGGELRAWVNGVRASSIRIIDAQRAELTLGQSTRCPLNVQVDNGTLPVALKVFTPKLDPHEKLWYCDVDLDLDPTEHDVHGTTYHGPEAYFPFIQFGLTRYQPHAAPGLSLSLPVATWAQIPPERRGSVSFHADRRIVVEHRGVGYENPPGAGGTTVDRSPLLNLRVMRASTIGRWPANASHQPAWTPALDTGNIPVQALRRPPCSYSAGVVAWAEELWLPPARPGVRYGLVIEEVELVPGDPDPLLAPEAYQEPGGLLHVITEPVERGPLFGHVVDLGD